VPPWSKKPVEKVEQPPPPPPPTPSVQKSNGAYTHIPSYTPNTQNSNGAYKHVPANNPPAPVTTDVRCEEDKAHERNAMAVETWPPSLKYAHLYIYIY
jgi:hypothetical protein